MKKERIAQVIMAKEGYILGINSPYRSTLFCTRGRLALSVTTYDSYHSAKIEDSTNLPPSVKNHLLVLGYKTIGMYNHWGEIRPHFVYGSIVYLKEYTAVQSEGKKYKIV